MAYRHRLFVCLGLLGVAATTIVVAPEDRPARAAAVTSGYCTADVTPTTGVSVSVANNGDCVVKFTSNTTVTWTRPAGISSFEALVVAGGGGGGGHPHSDPGGGGGGGVVHVPSLSLSGSQYEVLVGRGGVGNNEDPCGNRYFSGEDGGNSIFGTDVALDPPSLSPPSRLITAHGGGGGGGACDPVRGGGSGGGAHYGSQGAAGTRGVVDPSVTGATLYGNKGGDSIDGAAGGGGGATTVGRDGSATKAGDGGEGVALDVLGTGSPIVYGSGGGGAGSDVTPAIAPGLGGTNAGNAMQGDGSAPPDIHAVNGTGSGGGARMCPTTLPCTAGRGGDGVVLIRYAPTPVTPANTAVPVISGTLTSGSTLSATTGTWSGTSRTYSYVWQRASSASGPFTAIAGATSSTYVVTDADADSFLRVVVTATNAAGSASGTAVAVGPVASIATTTTTTSTIVAPTTTAAPVVAAAAPAPRRTNRVTRPVATPVAPPTATTVPVSVTPTTTPVAVAPTAPTAPDVQPGEASLVIDGEASSMIVSRRDNQLIVTNGNFTSTVSAVTADGERRPLDADGNIRLEEGDSLSFAATGFAADSEIDVWLFSTPSNLGMLVTDATGAANALMGVPADLEAGNHRVVISGETRDGKDAVMGVGLVATVSPDAVSTTNKVLIALPIALAMLAALIIPTRRRRRIARS